MLEAMRKVRSTITFRTQFMCVPHIHKLIEICLYPRHKQELQSEDMKQICQQHSIRFEAPK